MCAHLSIPHMEREEGEGLRIQVCYTMVNKESSDQALFWVAHHPG